MYRTVDSEGEQVNLSDADVWITKSDSNELEQVQWLRDVDQSSQRQKIWKMSRDRLYASTSTELTDSMPRPSALEIDGNIFMMFSSTRS